MNKKLITGMNGFGRFGLHLLKYWLDYNSSANFTIAYINDDTLDLAAILKIIHEDEYVKITPAYEVSGDSQGLLISGKGGFMHRIIYSNKPSAQIPWLGQPTYFLECSGKNVNVNLCQQFLRGNTHRVIVSATLLEADRILIFGANHTDVLPADRVISYGSCTLNAYIPLAKYLSSKYRITNSDANVVHGIQSYKLREMHKGGLLRQTCTLEASAPRFLSFLHQNNFIVRYTIAPYVGVSLMDIRFEIENTSLSLDEIVSNLEQAINTGPLSGLYMLDNTDHGAEAYIGSIYSAIIIKSSIRLLGRHLYLQCYFDNENSVNRYFDVVNYLSESNNHTQTDWAESEAAYK